jgi:thiol:disulfide interchange protein DsbA
MKLVPRLILILLALAPAVTLAEDAKALVADRDYQVIATPARYTAEDGRIEVAEVFGYTCGHCAYFAAEELDVVHKTHGAVFEAIHQRGTLPVQNVSAQELASFYGGHGVDQARFVQALRSDKVDGKLKAARSFAVNAGVRGTPNLVVNGKYLVRGSSFEDVLRITDALVARERAARRGR